MILPDQWPPFDQWMLGDLMLERCGPPAPNGVNNGSTGKVAEAAAYLRTTYGVVSSNSALREYRDVSHAYPADRRIPTLSWGIHRAVRHADRLHRIVVEWPGDEPITVSEVRKRANLIAGRPLQSMRRKIAIDREIAENRKRNRAVGDDPSSPIPWSTPLPVNTQPMQLTETDQVETRVAAWRGLQQARANLIAVIHQHAAMPAPAVSPPLYKELHAAALVANKPVTIGEPSINAAQAHLLWMTWALTGLAQDEFEALSPAAQEWFDAAADVLNGIPHAHALVPIPTGFPMPPVVEPVVEPPTAPPVVEVPPEPEPLPEPEPPVEPEPPPAGLVECQVQVPAAACADIQLMAKLLAVQPQLNVALRDPATGKFIVFGA